MESVHAKVFTSTDLVAFCDGSSLNNGRRGCKAGYACVFPFNEEWNVSKSLDEPNPTNNRAEYFGALEAIKRANKEDPDQEKTLYIFTDSNLLIRSMTEWLPGWQKRQWKKADGKAVKNVDILKMLLNEMGNRKLVWTHVKAHTNGKDFQSIWNAKADTLARKAASECS